MAGNRLKSLDALRGADMLFIMGFGTLLTAVCSALGCGDCWLVRQLSHCTWDGLHFEDTIFPLFLFIAGVTFPYSYAKSREAGKGAGAVVRKIIGRAVILFALGLVYNGILQKGPDDVVWGSVLGRIGIAWAAAALVYLALPSARGRIVLAAGILLGYWALLRLVGAPDHPDAFPLSPEGNLSGYLDRLLLPGRLTRPGLLSNQGTLSTLPAVVTAMLGMLVGDYMRNSQQAEGRKTAVLIGVAAALAAAGLLVAFGFGTWSMPLNKILWSSSFVLVVGGYSVAAFAVFHWIIDVRGYDGWTYFFRVIGMNSIAIYLLQKAVDVRKISEFFLGGVAGCVPSAWSGVVLAAGYVVFCWLVLRFLDRHKVYFKV